MPVSDFPFAALTAPEHSGALPAAADVVVIGGGIAGMMAAWELAGQGLSVVLCEKGRVGAEQSGRNWGWIRAQGRDPSEIPLAIEARRHWARWGERLGSALGLRQVGVTYLARTEAEMAEYHAFLPHARTHELDTRLLTLSEVEAMIPGAAPRWIGAMHTASDMRAEPWVAVPLMARAVAQAGVTIREGCAVRALDLAAGRVVGVLTEAGRIRADAVVLAGGAWSSLLLRAHGVSLPQLAVLSSAAATAPMTSVFDGAAVDDAFALRRREDGAYTLAPGNSHVMHVGPDAFRHFAAYWAVLRAGWRGTKLRPFAPRGFPDAWTTPRSWPVESPGPFEAMRILNPGPDLAALARVRDEFAKTFPVLGRPVLRAAWGGMIDTMPDVVPVLDHVTALPGLVLGTGLSGHGFGIGPAVGRVLADLVSNRKPAHDLSRFALARFAGGPLRPGPAL